MILCVIDLKMRLFFSEQVSHCIFLKIHSRYALIQQLFFIFDRKIGGEREEGEIEFELKQKIKMIWLLSGCEEELFCHI